MIPLLTDNYSFLLETETGIFAAVDPAEFYGMDRLIQAHAGRLDWILNTHHHHDHVGANRALKEKYHCRIAGPKPDAERIPGIDLELDDGDLFKLGAEEARVLLTPGHTRGHICYYFERARLLFCGDTLFSLGCGRLFEGTPDQMWSSLQKLSALPDETQVFCAHEYTEANGRFALSIDPENNELINKMERVVAARRRGEKTIPTVMGEEKRCNPFLRPFSEGIRRQLEMTSASDIEVFAEMRSRKDRF